VHVPPLGGNDMRLAWRTKPPGLSALVVYHLPQEKTLEVNRASESCASSGWWKSSSFSRDNVRTIKTAHAKSQGQSPFIALRPLRTLRLGVKQACPSIWVITPRPDGPPPFRAGCLAWRSSSAKRVTPF
jgi:hypothetical protein